MQALEDQTAYVKEQVIFECQMGDDEAEAEWKVAGEVVTENDRYDCKQGRTKGDEIMWTIPTALPRQSKVEQLKNGGWYKR